MVGLQWLVYSDGWAAVFRALQWFGCGVRGTKTVACDGLDTTMVGLRWTGYYDGWTGAIRVLRWFGCGGDGTTMVGLRW